MVAMSTSLVQLVLVRVNWIHHTVLPLICVASFLLLKREIIVYQYLIKMESLYTALGLKALPLDSSVFLTESHSVLKVKFI